MISISDFALLVGVGRFQNLINLEFIENDINGMRQVLELNFSIPEENLFCYIDADATSENIYKTVETICSKSNNGDRVILYFSTHGKVVYGAPYLATWEANPSSGSIDGWICTGKLFSLLHDSHLNVLAFLDACQSTMFYTIRDPLEYDHVLLSSNLPGEYIVALSAAGETQSAHQDIETQHGCWTFYLLEALKGNAIRAFSNGTTITVDSLHRYLVEKVSSRVKELYGEDQTPYKYLTCVVEPIIVELNIPEEKYMKIKDIYFGKMDADSELISMPQSMSLSREEFLSKNFYDLNSIKETLETNSGIYIIVGNKGTGKTYLGEYLSAYNNKASYQTIYQTLGWVGMEDLKKISEARTNERGKFVEAWSYLLYTVLACIIVNQNRPGAGDFSALLSDIYGPQTNLILSHFSNISSRRLLLNKKLKSGIRLGERYSPYADEKGVVTISHLILLYEDLFQKNYFSEVLYFLVDGLDENILGPMKGEQQVFLLDLLDAVNNSRNVIKNVRTVLLFRVDILHYLSGNIANMNKILTERACSLSWVSNDTTIENTPLYQLIELRIKTSLEVNSCQYPIQLKDLLPEKIQGIRTWNWILDLTTYTPRDIITFLNICQEKAGEQRIFNEQNLWDATKDYSSYLWNEFMDILGGTCLSSSKLKSSLLILFQKIAQTHSTHSSDKTSFSFSEFKAEYSLIEEFADIPVLEAMRILYESGIMQVHTPNGKSYWYFREKSIQFNPEIWKESTFDLHKGLWKVVGIW